MNLTYSEYVEENMDEIYQLMKTYFDPDYLNKRKELFRFVTTMNPFLSGKSPYNIIKDEGRIIGYLGRMPIYFVINGELKECCYSHDILILADYRGKGIGPKLIKSQVDSTDALLIALWFNPPNHRAFQKAGWTDVKGLKPFAKPLKANHFLAGRLKKESLVKILSPILNVMLAARDYNFLRKSYPGYSIEAVDSFHNEIDEFLERVSSKYSIIMSRKSEFLNWKYVLNKYQSYVRHIIKKHDEIHGYSIIKITKKDKFKHGTLIDFLVDPDNIASFEFLIREAIIYCRKNNVSTLSVLTTSPILKKTLLKTGFRQNVDSLDFMVANWEGAYSKEFITDINNWYITFGDSDYGIWT